MTGIEIGQRLRTSTENEVYDTLVEEVDAATYPTQTTAGIIRLTISILIFRSQKLEAVLLADGILESQR